LCFLQVGSSPLAVSPQAASAFPSFPPPSSDTAFNAAEADDAGPPVYTLFEARTVHDAWREWDVGIAGRPALEDLESRWGAKLRPEGSQRTAWSRRKALLDEILRRIARGMTAEAAVAELELLRAGRSLPKLIGELTRHRQRQQGKLAS
jgi:Transcriptional activator of glycolytic enzymes